MWVREFQSNEENRNTLDYASKTICERTKGYEMIVYMNISPKF